MRIRRGNVAVVLITATCSVAAFAVAPTPPIPTTGATPTRVAETVNVLKFATYNARGRKDGTASWRVSTAGGNCCEVYVSATPSGRLVESGGTYPWYTDDRGKTWYEVKFQVPDQNDNGPAVAGGEGATVVGPGGDIYGVTWDAYSGDHLQAYHYVAQTRDWQVAEVVLKTPFYDRPWLTYAKGPFNISGASAPYLLDAVGGGISKDIETISTDGTSYTDPRSVSTDESQSTLASMTIPVVRNPAADWWQPHPGTATMPLNAGGLLRFDASGNCSTPTARLNPADGSWQCVSLRANFRGVVRQDSRGYLTEVYPDGGGTNLQFATSRNGGLTWSTITLTPPPGTGSVLETSDLYNVIANGKLQQAVVTARWDDGAHHGHDIVFRVDEHKVTPVLTKIYAVGRGDLQTGNDVTSLTMPRFDYETVALFPDGKIAVTFDDSTCFQPTVRDPKHDSPEVAILI